jgi:hypothetical protein
VAILFGFLLGWLVAALLLAYYSPHCLRPLRSQQQFPTDHMYELNVFRQRGDNPVEQQQRHGVSDRGKKVGAGGLLSGGGGGGGGGSDRHDPYVVIASAGDDGEAGHAYGNGAVPSYMRMSYQQNGADSVLVAADSSSRQSLQLPPLQPPTDNGTTEGGRYGDYRQAGEAFNQLECAIVGPLAAEEQGGEERRRAADGFPRAAYINEPSAASSRSGAADEQTRMLC